MLRVPLHACAPDIFLALALRISFAEFWCFSAYCVLDGVAQHDAYPAMFFLHIDSNLLTQILQVHCAYGIPLYSYYRQPRNTKALMLRKRFDDILLTLADQDQYNLQVTTPFESTNKLSWILRGHDKVAFTKDVLDHGHASRVRR